MFCIINIVATCFLLGQTYGKPSKKLDLLIVMTSHENVKDVDLFVQKQFIGDILFEMEIGECSARVALMNYGDTPKVVWDFSSDIAKDMELMMDKIDGVKHIKGIQQSMVPVINMATQDIFNTRTNRVSAPDLTILFISTASESTDGLEETVDRLKDFSRVLVIPVTEKVNDDEVQAIADVTAYVDQFVLIKDTITNTSTSGECQECLPGFTDMDVRYSDSLTGSIVKRKMRPTNKEFVDVLKPNRPLLLKVKHHISITGEKLFYVPKVCVQTRYVKTIKLKGLDADNNLVGKVNEEVWGNGQDMTEKCMLYEETLEEVDLSRTITASFVPIDGHTEKMEIQNFDVLACSQK